MKIRKLVRVLCLVGITALTVYWGMRIQYAREVSEAKVAELIALSEVSLEDIPSDWVSVLLTVEDPTFSDNNGVDFTTPGQGMTTLSQGLGKRIFFDPFKPGFLKIELVLMTRFGLASKVNEKDILQAFLVSAYFGKDDKGPILGFSEAARRWYGKPLLSLSDDEFVGLVAMLVGPNAINPRDNPDGHAERVIRIKRLLAKECTPSGWLDVMLEGCAVANTRV